MIEGHAHLFLDGCAIAFLPKETERRTRRGGASARRFRPKRVIILYHLTFPSIPLNTLSRPLVQRWMLWKSRTLLLELSNLLQALGALLALRLLWTGTLLINLFIYLFVVGRMCCHASRLLYSIIILLLF